MQACLYYIVLSSLTCSSSVNLSVCNHLFYVLICWVDWHLQNISEQTNNMTLDWSWLQVDFLDLMHFSAMTRSNGASCRCHRPPPGGSVDDSVGGFVVSEKMKHSTQVWDFQKTILKITRKSSPNFATCRNGGLGHAPWATCARADEEVEPPPALLTARSSRSRGEKSDVSVSGRRRKRRRRRDPRESRVRTIDHWLGGTREQGSMFPSATSGPLLFLTLAHFLTRSGE